MLDSRCCALGHFPASQLARQRSSFPKHSRIPRVTSTGHGVSIREIEIAPQSQSSPSLSPSPATFTDVKKPREGEGGEAEGVRVRPERSRRSGRINKCLVANGNRRCHNNIPKCFCCCSYTCCLPAPRTAPRSLAGMSWGRGREGGS